MAKLFYIAGGTPAMRDQMKNALQRGLVAGLEIEPSLRLATRLVGAEAEAISTSANELTYAEAMQRIRQRRADINDEPLTEAQVIALLERGQVIQYTSYGGCVLPAKTGPCPTAEKCPVGTEPESQATAAGMGCPWQVLMPHAREHLTSEIAMMERKIEWYRGKPEYAFWLARELRHLDIWRKQVARLDHMEAAAGRAGA